MTRSRRGDGLVELLRALEALYEAALAPELWPDALARLGRLCGADWTVLSAIPIDPFSPGALLQNEDGDPELLHRFSSQYTLPETNPSVPILLAAPLLRVERREQYFADAAWERTDFYNDIYRPAGVYASAAAKVLQSPHYLVPVGLMRARSKGAFAESDYALMGKLMPHLHNAAQTMLRLTILTTRADALTLAWDQLPHGLFLLDGMGRVLWSNTTGERILAANNGLQVSNGRLRARVDAANRRLQHLIGACAAAGDHGGALRVPRRPPSRPLALFVSPMRLAFSSALFSGAHSPIVAIFASDPDLNTTAIGALKELYGFTEREAVLAKLLLEGCDLREAADSMKVSITTVRTHLGQLFRKTDTNRQAELVRLLANAVMRPIPPG